MELVIKPTDSINLVWSGSRFERLLYEDQIYKFCNHKDGHWVLEENFHKSVDRPDGLKTECKDCTRIIAKSYYERRKMKPILLEQQSYQCLICQDDLKNKPRDQIHVDHDHYTGVIRGVLCSKCNGALGNFKESIRIMLRACLYKFTNGNMGLFWNGKDRANFLNIVYNKLF